MALQQQHALPMFVLMKQKGDTSSFFNYGGSEAEIPNAVTMDSEKGVFNPLAKIEVERSQTDSSCVHLKFPQTKKYFSAYWYPGSTKAGVIVARSDKPEEDRTKPSCTLFKPVAVTVSTRDGEVGYQLIHVESGFYVSTDAYQGLSVNKINSNLVAENTFAFVDWNTIVKLPECVAFKGDNGKYLQAHQQEGHPYLQFSSDDPYNVASVFHVEPRLDGYVRVKSEYFGKYWRLSPNNWIWADESRDGSFDRSDDVFWPTKINESTVALRSAAANRSMTTCGIINWSCALTCNRYCARLHNTDGKTDCLNAAVQTPEPTTWLVVEELVSQRNIKSVIYCMDEALITDEKPHKAGIVMIENKGDYDAAMPVELKYEDEKSFNFSNGFPIMAGVAANVTASVPFIEEGSIKVNTEVTETFPWGHTITERISVMATGNVIVPARHMAVVHCVGTKGTCNVPFSYTQVDRSFVDERITPKDYHDGVFTGSNSYSFHFIIDDVIPI